jgi:hypothetical protein
MHVKESHVLVKRSNGDGAWRWRGDEPLADLGLGVSKLEGGLGMVSHGPGQKERLAYSNL